MLYDHDTFTHGGLTFQVTFPPDDSGDCPWEQSEGHGPVSDWTTRQKRPGELILSSHGNSQRFYDFAAAVKQAKAEGWNAKPYDIPGETKGQRAVKSVKADYKFLRDWCLDRWEYVGVEVVRLGGDESSASLWGIESCADDYLEEVAHELAAEIADKYSTRMAAEISESRPDLAPAYI